MAFLVSDFGRFGTRVVGALVELHGVGDGAEAGTLSHHGSGFGLFFDVFDLSDLLRRVIIPRTETPIPRLNRQLTKPLLMHNPLLILHKPRILRPIPHLITRRTQPLIQPTPHLPPLINPLHNIIALHLRLIIRQHRYPPNPHHLIRNIPRLLDTRKF